MKNKISLFLLIFLILGCTKQGVIPLKSAEVREYEGEMLGSVNDFRENSIKGPQSVNISNYSLRITGLVDNTKEYSYAEVLSNQKYSKVVTINCVEEWSVKVLWEGILVKDLLEEAGVQEEANTIIFHSVDKYTTSLPLDYVLNNNIILAYKMNNITLPENRGYPFQFVAEQKWGYKWIKWVDEIRLSKNKDYEGYWEKRGWSNTANINESAYK